jgi:hypothetical protein
MKRQLFLALASSFFSIILQSEYLNNRTTIVTRLFCQVAISSTEKKFMIGQGPREFN